MPIEVSELIDNYLKYQENIESSSALTIRAYRSDLKQAFLFKNKKMFLLGLPISDFNELWSLSRAALLRWGNLSLASRNRKIATLKSFFNWLYQNKKTDKNYAEQLICPKVPRKIPHFLSVDEIISVLQYLDMCMKENRESTVQIKALFLLLYGGGLRVSEACNLRWKQVQFSERRLLIKGKGNKERFAILPDYSFSALSALKEKNQKTDFVFGDSPLNTRTGYEIIRTLGKKVGLMNPLHPHALRHSFATHMLASGTNLRTLQSLLGHDSLQATEKYTHLSIDQLARTMDATHPLAFLNLNRARTK
ncbi:MAG: site-specific recombinase [Bdellovibrionales bacterium RIFCSPHIGHO2_01_FULL_40_29]|nr:MAG: site-specific recombinase [Bdellovibrionales bacterium RIFCSPHIGHO2_01_FULL_40_29]OFZ33946.1 MAG: site-specific recombinase [Bdellovibrionales bacterium RIFCSPHIGHO2_02_FULL_40_15]